MTMFGHSKYDDLDYVVMLEKLHGNEPLDHDQATMYLRTHERYSHEQAEAAVAEAEAEGSHAIKGTIGRALLLVYVDGGYQLDK